MDEKINRIDFTNQFNILVQQYQKSGFGIECSVIQSIDELCAQMNTNNVIEILKKTTNISFKKLSLGYTYLRSGLLHIGFEISGEKILFIKITWAHEEFSCALKYFGKYDKKSKKHPLTYLLAAFSQKMIGNFKRSNELLKIYKYLLRSEKNIKDREYLNTLNRYFGVYVILRETERDILLNKKIGINHAARELESIVNENNDIHIANILMSWIYLKTSQTEKYIMFLEQWSSRDSQPFILEALGRIHLWKKEYEKSLQYFEKAKELWSDAYRKGICECFVEFLLGLQALSEMPAMKALDSSSVYKYFYATAELIDKHNIWHMDDIKYLPLVYDISNRAFRLFLNSRSLYELNIKIQNLYSELQNIFSHWKSFDQYISDRRNVGDFSSDLILYTNNLITYVGFLLKLPPIKERVECILKKMNESQEVYWEKNFKLMTSVIKESLPNFQNGIYKILQSFATKIGNREITEIQDNEQRIIMEQTGKLFKPLDEELVIVLETMVQKMYDEFGDMKLQTSEILKILQGSKKSMMTPNHVVEIQHSEILKKISENKIKILANEIIFRENDVIFKNTGNTYSAESIPIRLLVYLLLKRKLHWFYGYLICPKWLDKEPLKAAKVFGQNVSKLIDILELNKSDYLLPLKKEERKKGFDRCPYLREEVEIKSNILDSQKEFIKSKFIYDTGKYEDAKRILESNVFVNYPDKIEPSLLYIECLFKQNITNIPDMKIMNRNAGNFVRELYRLYGHIIIKISQYFEQKKFWIENGDEQEAFNDMNLTYRRIEKIAENIKLSPPISPSLSQQGFEQERYITEDQKLNTLFEFVDFVKHFKLDPRAGIDIESDREYDRKEDEALIASIESSVLYCKVLGDILTPAVEESLPLKINSYCKAKAIKKEDLLADESKINELRKRSLFEVFTVLKDEIGKGTRNEIHRTCKNYSEAIQYLSNRIKNRVFPVDDLREKSQKEMDSYLSKLNKIRRKLESDPKFQGRPRNLNNEIKNAFLLECKASEDTYYQILEYEKQRKASQPLKDETNKIKKG